MKKALFLSGLGAALLLLTITFSCKKNFTAKPNESVTMQTDSNFVSLATATTAATQATISKMASAVIAKKSVQGFAGLTTAKQVLDVLAVPDNINPSYYIFNYSGGGFAIISSDKRVEPVLAYADKGYFPRSGNISGGLAHWLTVNHENMQLVKKNPQLKVPKNVARFWAELVTANPAAPAKQAVNQAAPPPPTCEDSYSEITVAPLTQTTWGQGYPYNVLCPAGNFDAGHTPTGCVATAMAQIMYKWKYPANYAWNTMPLYTYGGGSYGDVAQLMLDVGTSVNMVYDDSGSHPYTSIPFEMNGISCSDAFKNSFSYSSSNEGSYDYQTVIANLNAGEPVLLSASTDHDLVLFWGYRYGHVWVCDGYYSSTFNICPSGDSPGMGGSYLYLDMNWGWDNANNCNGLYYYNNWTVLNDGQLQYYQYNQSMTYNIHP